MSNESERIDRDVPRGADAYVLRLEDAAGHRLLIRVAAAELESADTLERLRAKAEMLIVQFLYGTGKLAPEEVKDAGWTVSEKDGITCLVKVIEK